MHSSPESEETILQRYEWIVDDRLIGFVDYYVFDQVYMIMHTEVVPALAGQGYGSRLAHQMMEYVHSQGKRIVPVCGFLVHYLRKHPQHHALVTATSRRIFSIGLQEDDASAHHESDAYKNDQARAG
jgi:predicted GNAT family acetyltransferase